MKFKVCWYESHNPDNWSDTYEKGIENLKDSFPTVDIHLCPYGGNEDGWVELTCEDIFEADNIKEAKEKILDNYDFQANGGVFTVFDPKTDERLFTEEDL